MPGWFDLTGLEHDPQGYFQFGPGFISTSPASIISQKKGVNFLDVGDNLEERCKKRRKWVSSQAWILIGTGTNLIE